MASVRWRQRAPRHTVYREKKRRAVIREPKKTPTLTVVLPNWLQALSGLGLLGLAYFTAFFSDLPLIVEGALRAESARLAQQKYELEKTNELLRKENEFARQEKLEAQKSIQELRRAEMNLQFSISEAERSFKTTLAEMMLLGLPKNVLSRELPVLHQLNVEASFNWADEDYRFPNKEDLDIIIYREAESYIYWVRDQLKEHKRFGGAEEISRRFNKNCPTLESFKEKTEGINWPQPLPEIVHERRKQVKAIKEQYYEAQFSCFSS